LETNKPIAKLRSVFGALSHAPPGPSQSDVEAKKKAKAEKSAYVAETLPAAPVYHQKTGVLMVPSKRFDGSTDDAPWNMPEPVLWDWLRTANIEHIEERSLSGVGGVLWARYRNFDGQLRSALLRFGGVSRGHALEHWGAEYNLEGPYDLLKREQAAYEVMKALGCEDIAPPLAAKETNLVPLISDATRDRVGRELRIAPILVDETFGLVGLMQSVPQNAENFAEYWAKLGPDETNRWERVSARLRHSMYRAILLDFFMGVPNRMLCDYMYQRSSDSLALYGFEVAFPHPGLTAEWYLAMRKKGWGRKFSGPLEEPMIGMPAGGVDSLGLMATFSDAQSEEMVMTAKQMVKGFDPQTATLLIQVLSEIGIPPANIAGFVSKIVFLENEAEDIVSNSFDYVRSVLVPLRRGYGLEEGRIQMVANTTSQIMTMALGQEFDFAATVQEPTPEGVEFSI
jgi:hypothetical protein